MLRPHVYSHNRYKYHLHLNTCQYFCIPNILSLLVFYSFYPLNKKGRTYFSSPYSMLIRLALSHQATTNSRHSLPLARHLFANRQLSITWKLYDSSVLQITHSHQPLRILFDTQISLPSCKLRQSFA